MNELIENLLKLSGVTEWRTSGDASPWENTIYVKGITNEQLKLLQNTIDGIAPAAYKVTVVLE